MRRLLLASRRLAPFIVSGVVLAFLLTTIDARHVVGQVTPEAALLLVPALILFGFVSLGIEGISLHRLARAPRRLVNWWTCCRVKAASYPLGLLHYALGATTLTVLLGRRAGIPIANAAGVVILIALYDLVILLLICAMGAVLLTTDAPALRAGIVVAITLGFSGGFALLRLPTPLGPLERIRSLTILRAARTTSLSCLSELMLWRLLFVASFVAIVWAALVAFGISVPLGDLVVNVAALALVSALPIAIAGLGTGQLAFVYLFRQWGEPDTLLACSLTLSAGLILVRAAPGLLFAREFSRQNAANRAAASAQTASKDVARAR